MFQIEPDAVVAVVSGVTNEEGQEMTHRTEAGELIFAKFGDNFTASHERVTPLSNRYSWIK
jgi:hypothetical protein